MADPRHDAARAKLRRFLPPPAPGSGWGYARQRIEAQFLGVEADIQAAAGESQLLFPAVLARTDASPSNWSTDEHNWIFSPTTPSYTGAQGDWLDLWGAVLGVPREPAEPDGLYGPRILAEILRPTTTNIGLAQAIDQGMGILGTEVLEAEDVLTVYRFDSPGLRMDSSTAVKTKRLDMAGEFGGNSLAACFIVRVPTGAQQPYNESTIRRLSDRRKAAGTRLIGIYTADGGAILAPDSVTVGVSSPAYILPIAGATYAWTVSGGVIESGQGTNSITFHASSAGQVGLSLVVTLPSGNTNYYKPVQAYNAINPMISVSEYMMAGTFRAVASIPPPGNGFTIEWTATGLDIEGPSNQTIVTFDVGQPSTTATLTVTLRNAAGGTGSATAQVKSVPFTSDEMASTPSLGSGATAYIEMPLGWEYNLLSITVDRQAWVRIYNTAADRAADSARLINQDPPDGFPIVGEGVLTTSLTVLANPNVKGTNGDFPRTKTAYLAVTNLAGPTGPVTVTVHRTETRTSGLF